MNVRKLISVRSLSAASLAVACMSFVQSAAEGQSLTAWTNPPSGLAGFNDSYATGSGFPAGTILASGATAHFGTSCAAPAVASSPVLQVTVVATLRRFEFLIPATLTTGNYFVWITGTAGSTPFNTLSTPSCSEISVGATSTTIAACVPTSSLAIVAGSPSASNVTAYVPFGSWGSGTTGIEQVPIEGTGVAAANFPTTGEVNSCAANSVTGEVVCTENTTNVDLINQTSFGSFSTVTSSATAEASFTGGQCFNCGVAINSTNNTAVIAMGSTLGGGSGVQVLNLSNNTFNSEFSLANYVSEDISIDSGRNLILSPAEDGIYDLLQIGAGNTLTEFGNNISADSPSNDLDSAAEDCTTGIALSSAEFSDYVYITDLTQAVFTPGSPGTWTAPGQFLNLNDGDYSAGTSGISTAPGTNHLGVVTGEFGGQAYSALQLPSTSGTGTPTLADWAYVSAMPNTPDGAAFAAGFDPHTVTSYTSPNNNKSYAVFADWAPGQPDYIAVVDLACVLALPRSGAHTVANPATATVPCTNYIAVP